MSLPADTKLGPYEILASIGKGGMGEVYKARDPRLNRDVAIKVSAERFSERFEREAQAIAALNHPNICTLYDVGPNYLVMEYIEGEAPQGPLPIDEALRIAKQIADALEAAHEKGIVHRDLKPGNIKIKPDGTVKVLDFGLATVAVTQASTPLDQADSPTLTIAATQAGMILGTAGYMSPEQARGKQVDKRADIWAFGVVLYELLTGKRLFEGDDITDTLAAVLRHEPDWGQVPAKVRRLLRRCLVKDPAKRLRDIGDAWELLEEQPATAPSASKLTRDVYLAWEVAVVFMLAFAALTFVHFRQAPPEVRSVRFQIQPPEKSSIQFFRLSPDGRLLAFTAGDRRLWIRPLDSLQAQPLAGTDAASYPFWSPDSRFIGFFAQGKLKKIAAAGGPPQILCDAPNARGGTWNREGLIVFAPALTSGLFRVSAAGGVPVQVTKIGDTASALAHLFPEFLPDGRRFIYSTYGAIQAGESGIYAGSLDGETPVRLLSEVSNAIYAGPSPSGETGRLLLRRGDTLMAQPFDPARLRMTGDVFPVAEHVGTTAGNFVLGAFSLSANGTLAYASSGSVASQLAWVDRAGKALALFGPPGVYVRFRLAPDEKRIVFDSTEQSGNQDVWVLDSVRGVTSRLSFDPAQDNVPMWSYDGLRIVWPSSRNGKLDLYIKSANGNGQEELFLKMGTANGWAADWSNDGRFVLYQMPGVKTGQDLWIAPQFGDRKAFPYLQTQFDEQDGRFSPDGHWIAYFSNESGRDEVYVQSFPLSGAKFQISSAGGSEPQWRKDGNELFYLASDQMLMAVPVKLNGSTSEPFQAGAPKPLMAVPPAPFAGLSRRSYAVSNNGQRFLMPSLDGSENSPPLNVVVNWQAGLKK